MFTLSGAIVLSGSLNLKQTSGANVFIISWNFWFLFRRAYYFL